MCYMCYMCYACLVLITIANTKGGSGKTTTAIYLALAATNAEPQSEVTLLDFDPQGSATAWSTIARDSGDSLPFETKIAALHDIQALRKLQSSGGERNIIFADTAPGDGSVIRQLIQLSDLVVVTTEPDGLGLARTYATLDIAGDRGAVLLTRVRKRTKLYAEAVEALNEDGCARFETEIPDSVRYRTYGTTPTTAGEYAAVWQEIKEVLQ